MINILVKRQPSDLELFEYWFTVQIHFQGQEVVVHLTKRNRFTRETADGVWLAVEAITNAPVPKDVQTDVRHCILDSVVFK